MDSMDKLALLAATNNSDDLFELLRYIELMMKCVRRIRNEQILREQPFGTDQIGLETEDLCCLVEDLKSELKLD